MAHETFQVRIADRTVEFVWDGTTLSVNGRPVDASVEPTAHGHVSVLVDGHSLSVCVESAPPGPIRLRTTDGAYPIDVIGNRERLLRSASGGDGRMRHHFAVLSPMPGLIVMVNVAPGDVVAEGDSLLVLEAMKMENEIRATHGGTVERVHVNAADVVLKNALLVEFESR